MKDKEKKIDFEKGRELYQAEMKMNIEEMAYMRCGLEHKPTSCSECIGRMICDEYINAEKYIKQGYRIIDEDSVVLSREEAERFRGQTINIAKVKSQARKETVEQFAKTIISVIWEETKNETIRIKDLHGVVRDIANAQFGVEIKE